MRPNATPYRGTWVDRGPLMAGARPRADGRPLCPVRRVVGPSIGPGSAMIARCRRAATPGSARARVSTVPPEENPRTSTLPLPRRSVKAARSRTDL